MFTHFKSCALFWIIHYIGAYCQCLNTACSACYCGLGTIFKYHFSSWVRNNTILLVCTNPRLEWETMTNTGYSPLEPVDINPKLEQETMDNIWMSLEWFTTRHLLAKWVYNASIECSTLKNWAVECCVSATLP